MAGKAQPEEKSVVRQTLDEWLAEGNRIERVESPHWEQVKKPIKIHGPRPMRGRQK